MNILHLSRTMGQGGAEKIVYQLSLETKKAGHSVFVASSGGVCVEILNQKQIPHYQIHDLECKNPMIMLQTLKSLIKIIKREKIQILHMHHRMAAFYGKLLKMRFPNVVFLYTAHNVFFDKKRLTHILLSKTAIVAVGNSVKSNLIDFFQLSEHCIQVIYNAVQIDATEVMQENTLLKNWKEQGFSIIGTIGRLSEQKGMDVFIKAFARAKAENPFLKGIIIGDGELREQLQNMIIEHGLQEDIYMMGYQKDILSFVKQMDFIIMPSRWEGFPLTPIEMFSEGKTLIASDIGGINEIVRHGENGILVEMDNADAFYKEIVYLLTDLEKRKRLEENGKRYYLEHFNFESFIEQYHNLYKKLLAERGHYENMDHNARTSSGSCIKGRCS